MTEVYQFIEEMALKMEERGFPRMAGRVMAWLMICKPKQQTMPDLVEALDASKSSISTATRMLIQFDLVERVSLRGERKDFYQLREGIWNDTIKEALEKINKFKSVAERGLDLLKDNDSVRLNVLSEMKEAYEFWEQELPPIQEKWEKQKGKN